MNVLSINFKCQSTVLILQCLVRAGVGVSGLAGSLREIDLSCVSIVCLPGTGDGNSGGSGL